MMQLESPIGFSSEALEVVKKKPQARVLDCTAGNRQIWGENKFRDDVIFTDKEAGLRIQPDLLSEWRDLPTHFPRDYFHCAIFDPPHLIYINENSNHWDPAGKTWWGYWLDRKQMVRGIVSGQQAIAKVSPRLCFKWGESRDGGNIDRILTLFTEWRESIRFGRPSGTGSGNTCFWVKLVRKEPAYASTQNKDAIK